MRRLDAVTVVYSVCVATRNRRELMLSLDCRATGEVAVGDMEVNPTPTNCMLALGVSRR